MPFRISFGGVSPEADPDVQSIIAVLVSDQVTLLLTTQERGLPEDIHIRMVHVVAEEITDKKQRHI